jgi:hypothetical protein
MRRVTPLHGLRSLLLACPVIAFAQAASEREGMLYLESLAMPKRASVCSARIAGYSARFDPLYARWSAANQARLAAGETLLRAEAAKANRDFAFHAQAAASIDAQLLEKAGPGILQENCDAMLQRLASGA